MQIGPINLPERPVILAPMEDVSDSPFRQMCKRLGADMVYTEFISSEAIIRDSDKSMHKMRFEEMERPFGIQIFGGREEAMEGAAQIAEASKPDLVDINFGCPVYKIVKKNAGSACLRDLGLMERMTEKVVEATGLPVTVKTRLGWDEETIRIQEVALMLQRLGVKALTVHCRTRAQGYKGTARWEYLKLLKDTPGLTIPIIGNGDITTPQEAKHVFDTTGVDGVMIGRAAIGNPWIFRQMKVYLATGEMLPEPSLQERMEICAEQLKASVIHHGEKYGVITMKKHYGNYLKGIRNGKKLRLELMEHDTAAPIIEALLNFNDQELYALG
ncbi:tRNA-U20-dihydrouridine synthase [Cyclonatronum proteinivorum]|uniref:tRNA-dihydrouridine synthase n=1 Tax=Cyclonatronum proteinivorum TaxID=1457365 RepID=A0A345UKV7_9BACT|nr:tRNA dihydrouridine synthase DusB [Cyclonatronum proteinivorum]AXJ01109.1 tRNA-U20-dihydrouridine synthase [Cyclonatronum proteinivorum]